MPSRISELLDAHDNLREKTNRVRCPMDILAEGGVGDECRILLDETLYTEGSHFTEDHYMMLYRRCGREACAAEVGIAVDDEGFILDAARYQAPCTGKL